MLKLIREKILNVLVSSRTRKKIIKWESLRLSKCLSLFLPLVFERVIKLDKKPYFKLETIGNEKI